MTVHRMRSPLTVALLLLLLSWSIRNLEQGFVNFVRLSLGFVMVAGLVWVIQRLLTYEGKLEKHREDIIALVARAEALRTETIESLVHQTAEIAAALAIETARKAEAATVAAEERHEAIKQRLDDVLLEQRVVAAIPKVDAQLDVMQATGEESNQILKHARVAPASGARNE